MMHQHLPLQSQERFQAEINSSPRVVAQAKWQAMIDTSPRQIAQRQRLAEHFGQAGQQQAAQKGEAWQIHAASAPLQRQSLEDEDLLTGQFASSPRQDLEDEELLQGKFAIYETPTQTLQSTHEVEASRPVNHTGLPDKLKSGVESLSGLSLHDVRVHYNSPKPAQLNALAYTQGADIHVAPGQERHLPHEAWHVVQQKQRRVKPTLQLQGVAVNDDNGLEHEADVMGAQAVRHAEGPPPLHLTPRIRAASGVTSTTAPVQRLIGFELEYQVPTFGSTVEAVNLQEGENPPSNNLKYFLFGGLPYGTKLGGSAERGENSFRLTTDHNKDISREPIRAKLASMGKLDPADTQDRDASSNLEYVTSPVDELAKGSDKVLSDLIDQVSKHATATFAIANEEKIGKIPAPASTAATGTPVDNFKTWLSAEDFEALKPTLDSFWLNICDSIYIQATIGVIPGAVGTLLKRAAGKESLHHTGNQFDQIYMAVETASKEVRNSLTNHKYIQDLKKRKETHILTSLSGMIQLLVMYLVGEALSQTSSFPGGSIKNDVPFLVKIDPAKIADSGPIGMQIFDEVPDDFATTLAEALSGREEITVKYWRELGYEARLRKEKDWVTAGSVANLTKMFLQGKKPSGTGAQTGSQLKTLDPMKEISSSLFPHNQGQTGIPLEYRYVKARPTATGLKTELLKIVKEAREVNLSQSSEEEKQQIEKQVKE